ncbi:unnamed protein product, partial [Closterium sp. NIES-54]
KPLRKLLGRPGLAPTLLLLTLATPRTDTPSASPTATSPTTSIAATPTAASTTATRAPTPANSPTAATTSTAAPTTTPVATSTTAAATSTAPATLALTAAALCTSRSSPDVLRNGDVGDASVFHVWGCRAFVRDTSVDNLSARAIPCVFFGFPPNAPGWQFYHPTSRRALPSHDVTFDESVPFYPLFPYSSAPLLPPPLFLAPGPPSVDPPPPSGSSSL